MSTKTRTEWTKDSTHPLVCTATINGAHCTIRCHRGQWTSSIYRDDAPVEVTPHDNYFEARRHCEGAAKI